MTSPLDAKLDFTFFRDAFAQTMTADRLSLRELAERIVRTSAHIKSALPWLKGAVFGDIRTRKGSLRNNANLRIITCIEVDYDLEVIAPEIVAEVMRKAGIACLIYTSPSHKPGKPRWRILCPLSEFLPGSDREYHVARLNGLLGGVLSRESFTLSQAYYFGSLDSQPACQTWLIDGQCIDQVGGLEPLHPKPVKPPAAPALPAGTIPTARLAAACALFGSGSERHPNLLLATSMVSPMVKSGHLDRDQVVDAIASAMLTLGGREPNDQEVDRALDGSIAQASPYVDGSEFDVLPIVTPRIEAAWAIFDESSTSADDSGIFVRELTEDCCALEFAERHAARFKFDVTAGGSGGIEGSGLWYRFVDGQGWQVDQRGEVHETARDMVRRIRKQRAFGKDTMGAASIGFPAAVIRGCRHDSRMAVISSDWDADHFTLGVQGGQVDLRTGIFSPASPDQFIRLRTSVKPADPGTPTPLWTRYLLEATGHDLEFIAWLQRLAGYGLTGDISEEMLSFFYGPGGAGKGTFLGSLEQVMGQYAYKAPMDLFRADSRINREYQLAKLDGVRMVFSSETEQGHLMAESLVKEVTGNEGGLNARHPYGKPFTFTPQFKLLIVGNYAPKLAGRSEAMERRLKVAPFNRIPPVKDTTLKERLRDEFPGILRWMIDGCLMWQRERLGRCVAVDGASTSYFEEQDSVTLWAAERCSVGNVHRASATVLLDDFNAWLRQRGDKTIDSKSFKDSIITRLPGIDWKRSNGQSFVIGIALRSKTANEFDDILS